MRSVTPSDDTRRTATVERLPDEASLNVDQLWEDEWRRNLMTVAIERVKRRVSIKEFQIFDLYVLEQCPVAEVKQILNVSATYIYVVKHRVAGLIRKEITKLKRELE